MIRYDGTGQIYIITSFYYCKGINDIGIIMAVENNVNVQSSTNQYQSKVDTKAQNKGNPNAVDKTPEKDTVQLASGLTTKEKVGIGAAITTGIALITLAVLGRNGHLGEGVQKFLGGKAKKAAQEMGEHTHTPTGTTQVKQETMVTEQVVKPEPVKMEMTDEAKKVYDNVSSKLNQKTEITADTIDANLKPREKDAVWSAQDRQEYYTQLEQDSLKNKQEAQEILKGIEESRIQANKAEQKAEIAQTVYGVAPFERGLSHKSARESAGVFKNAFREEDSVSKLYLKELYKFKVSQRNDSEVTKSVLNKIDMYLQNCETFKKVNKTVDINGKPIKIIYEGLGYDVTENGELMKKVFNPVSRKNSLVSLSDRRCAVEEVSTVQRSQTQKQRALA